MKGTYFLQPKEFIDEFMFGVRQSVEAVMEQKDNENAIVTF